MRRMLTLAAVLMLPVLVHAEDAEVEARALVDAARAITEEASNEVNFHSALRKLEQASWLLPSWPEPH